LRPAAEKRERSGERKRPGNRPAYEQLSACISAAGLTADQHQENGLARSTLVRGTFRFFQSFVQCHDPARRGCFDLPPVTLRRCRRQADSA
jgi:hypothetical protein